MRQPHKLSDLTRIFHKLIRGLSGLLIAKKGFAQSGYESLPAPLQNFPINQNSA